MTRFVAGICSVSMVFVGMALACGQDYPNKPIRMFAAASGGGNDFSARLIAQGLSSSLNQQVIIDNRAAMIGIESVANAAPDGYTLLFQGSTLWLAPLLQDNVPWDPVRDFLPIALTTISPSILVVHPSVPVKSVRELIALAKAKPGQLNYASSSTGGAYHLAAELFNSMAGVNIVRISYKLSAQAVTDLIGGQVQLMFATAASGMPHVKSGKLRALAVGSLQPSALTPGLPTLAASGVPRYESVSILGIWAPRKTPASVSNRLNQEITRFLSMPDVKQKLLDSGVEAVGSSQEQFSATIRSDMARWSKVIKDAGIRAE